jgi:periplasmic protein TonB
MDLRWRRIAALVSMVVGFVAVCGLVYTMNELTKPPQPEPKASSQEFAIDKPPEPPPRPRPRQRPRPQRQAQTPRSAPAPDITTALSGLSFDLPQLAGHHALDARDLLGDRDATRKLVMTEDSVDTLPRPRSRSAPEYPARARQRGIQGHVLLRLRISERGVVEHVRVLESEPAGVFDAVAVAAVRQWTFEPATYQGVPVTLTVSQRIPFRLN